LIAWRVPREQAIDDEETPQELLDKCGKERPPNGYLV